MLKLTVEAGEYLMIGEDIKVVFAGGTSRHARVLVDAPKSLKVLRSNAVKVMEGGTRKVPMRKYKKERELSQEARAKINAILAEERKRIKTIEG
ncbi:MAG: carbon storage regulator [Lachnospiraceae bacterium]|nr:carbon storage regulator [Lachnospiraceae bacterium]